MYRDVLPIYDGSFIFLDEAWSDGFSFVFIGNTEVLQGWSRLKLVMEDDTSQLGLLVTVLQFFQDECCLRRREPFSCALLVKSIAGIY